MAFTEGLCPNIQRALVEVAEHSGPPSNLEATGLVDALMSDANFASGIEMNPIRMTDGKVRSMTVKYRNRAVRGDVATSITDFCSNTNEVNPQETVVTLDKQVQITRQFTEADIRKICESQNDWIAGVFNDTFNALALQMEYQLLTAASSVLGKYGGQTAGSVNATTVTAAGSGYTSAPRVVFSGGAGTGAAGIAVIESGALVSIYITNPGTGYTSAPTIAITGGGGTGATATCTIASNATSGTATAQIPLIAGGTGVNGVIMGSMLETIVDSGIPTRPFLIGAGKLAEAVRALNLGCCNSSGIDLGRAADDFFYFRSRQTATVLGADSILAVQPGAAQILSQPMYVGEYAKTSNTFVHGTITDPWRGITYDLKMNYDDCNDVWRASIQLNYALFTVPTDLYATGDYLAGTNGLLKFKVY
jgi:hypothetical protein